MSTASILILTITVLAAALMAVLFALATSTVVQSRRHRRQPLVDAARSSVVASLSTDSPELEDVMSVLSELLDREVATIITELVTSFNGSSLATLNAIAEKSGLLPKARAGIHSRRWSRRLYSARLLTAFAAEPDHLPALLIDRAPEVRAQAAAWAAIKPDQEAIDLLVVMLDDPDGICRFAAQNALITIGPEIAPALTGLMETDRGRTTHLALQVAAVIGDERFIAPAVDLTKNGSPTTRARAASVLAGSGDPSTAPALIDLLSDQSREVRAASARGLSKLGCWPASAQIEPLLSDDDQDVRREAARALCGLGAPGMVLLQVNSRGVGRSAQTASQMLQINSLGAMTEAA